MEKKFYTIYKITNLINNNFYIGAHSTNDLEDDYMGSGELIKRAIEKYGIENFKRDWLHIFKSPEEMWSQERLLVNEEIISRAECYNMVVGGSGNFAPKGSEAQAKRIATLKYKAAIKMQEREDEYLKSPTTCKNCNSIIPFRSYRLSGNKAKFYNRSCSASYNNKQRTK